MRCLCLLFCLCVDGVFCLGYVLVVVGVLSLTLVLGFVVLLAVSGLSIPSEFRVRRFVVLDGCSGCMLTLVGCVGRLLL